MRGIQRTESRLLCLLIEFLASCSGNATDRDVGPDSHPDLAPGDGALTDQAPPDEAVDSERDTGAFDLPADRPDSGAPDSDAPPDTAGDGERDAGVDLGFDAAFDTALPDGGHCVYLCVDAGAGDAAAGGKIGDACTGAGTLACAGGNQKDALICNKGTWQLRETCSATQNCDQQTGVCVDIVPQCAQLAPGAAFCVGDDLNQCGPDRVTLTTQPCCGKCVGGACQVPWCGDNKVEGTEECDDGNSAPADGCEPDCVRSAVLQLAGGLRHTCALLRGGRVRCWGGNASGQLGQGHTQALSSKLPHQIGLVDLGGTAIAIAAGEEHTCAVLSDGTVQCWGCNGFGQLGLGHTKNIGDDEAPRAQRVPLEGRARSITAGGSSTCASMETGAVRCWGRNDFGQLGLGHSANIGDDEAVSAANSTVTLGASASAVAMGGWHACAIMANNTIRCWGNNSDGELGLGTKGSPVGDDELPTAQPAIDYQIPERFISISAGYKRACALRDHGPLQCWGSNSDGGLGIGLVGEGPFYAPDIGGMQWGFPIDAGAVGAYHACAATQDHHLRCWGPNQKAQLGMGHTYALGDDESLGVVPPIDLGTGSDGKAAYALLIGTGQFHTCVLVNTGAVKCWGLNADGQLGLGFTSSAPDYVGGTQTQIPALLEAVHVFAADQ